jgi:tetratricopeptide (TPR) repeat protein
MMIRAAVLPFACKYRFSRLCASLTAVLMGALLSSSAVTQRVSSNANEVSMRIADGLKQIQEGKQNGLSDSTLGYLWAKLADSYQEAADWKKALAAYEHALQLLGEAREDRANYATALDNLGSLYLEFGRIGEAEKLRKRALAIRKEIGSPQEIAWSEADMAEVALLKHRFKDAEKASRAVFETMSAEEQSGDNVSTELSALVTLIFAECMQSKQEEGLHEAERAMQLVEKNLPADSVDQAHVSMALGFAQWKTGANAEAERSMLDGLRILRSRSGPTSPNLRAAMYEYRGFLKAMHRGPEVTAIEKRLAEMTPQDTSKSCAGCTVSVYALR